MSADIHDVARTRLAVGTAGSRGLDRSATALASTLTPNSLIRIATAVIVLLHATSPAHAASCEDSIGRVQAQLDAAIEKNAGAHGWGPESLDALRSHQPTPRSLAQAEGPSGQHFQLALDALSRARAADRSRDIATCRREVSQARQILLKRTQ